MVQVAPLREKANCKQVTREERCLYYQLFSLLTKVLTTPRASYSSFVIRVNHLHP